MNEQQKQNEQAKAEAVKVQEFCDSLEIRCADMETKVKEAVEDKRTAENRLEELEHFSAASASVPRLTGLKGGLSWHDHDSSTLEDLKGHLCAVQDKNADYEDALQQFEGTLVTLLKSISCCNLTSTYS